MKIDDGLRKAVENEFDTAYGIIDDCMRLKFKKPGLQFGTEHLMRYFEKHLGKMPTLALLNALMLYDDTTNEIIITNRMLGANSEERLFGFLHEHMHAACAHINHNFRGSVFQKLISDFEPKKRAKGMIHSAVAEGLAQYLAVTLALDNGDRSLRFAASNEHKNWLNAVPDDITCESLSIYLKNFSRRCALGYQFIRAIDPVGIEIKKIILRPPQTMREFANPLAYARRLGI